MPSIRVMTYNVRYFGHGTRGVFSTRGALRRIADSVASLQPMVDVLCLQEVERNSLRSSLITSRRRTQLDALMGALDEALERRGIRERYVAKYFPAHTYRLTRRANLYTTGLAILVRERLAVAAHNAGEVADITHRRAANKHFKQTRICAHVTVDTPKGKLDVFNTHMSLPGLFYTKLWNGGDRFGHGPNQLLEAKRLVEVMTHRKRGDSVVLVGDFNSLPGSPVDQLLREKAGLVDALAHAKGLAGERLRSWSTAGFMSKRMNIDRVYSSGVEWLDFDDSSPFDGPHPATSFEGLSDHVPILGRLRLAAEGAPRSGMAIGR
jgi:endonuclease/exonuclease/phosphatase family metal-dependent hydrolase